MKAVETAGGSGQPLERTVAMHKPARAGTGTRLARALPAVGT